MGEIRRKAWLLDSPARRTGSDGMGAWGKKTVSAGLAARARRPVRQGNVDVLRRWCGRPPVRRLARAPTGAGGSERWGLCWLRSTEASGIAAVRDPRRRSRRRSASPLNPWFHGWLQWCNMGGLWALLMPLMVDIISRSKSMCLSEQVCVWFASDHSGWNAAVRHRLVPLDSTNFNNFFSLCTQPNAKNFTHFTKLSPN
jgi:hypothetical protein